MRILLIHQNYPGQYKHIGPALVAEGHEVFALCMNIKTARIWSGVKVFPYVVSGSSTKGIHPWIIDFETNVLRGEAVFHAARELDRRGFRPDIILAHPGWGEAMFIKDVWPDARLGLYCELYHLNNPEFVNFDPEFMLPLETDPLRLRLKNLNNHLHFEIADAGISPTHFQADTFPQSFRDQISVIHDGIDTKQVRPNPEARFRVNDKLCLSRSDEVITFVNRNFEPYRGYHIFMRALPGILARRPDAQVLLLGGDQVGYGAAPVKGSSKQIFIDEVRHKIPDADWQRVHFLDPVPYDQFLTLLQVSRVHIYLTYPFVLSWSMLEAMSTECAILASNTGPVRDVLQEGKTGYLVDFFDIDALTNRLCDLLDDPQTRARLGRAARQYIQKHFDLKTVCLPRQLEWVTRLSTLPVQRLKPRVRTY